MTGDEDCLAVNVFSTTLPPGTATANSEEPRPVMAFLHGGLFNGGSSSPRVYGPELLVDRDVVMNMRSSTRSCTHAILYVRKMPSGRVIREKLKTCLDRKKLDLLMI